MYIQQVELTQGVGKDFVNALTAMSVKEDHEQGDILLRFEKMSAGVFLTKYGLDIDTLADLSYVSIAHKGI